MSSTPFVSFKTARCSVHACATRHQRTWVGAMAALAIGYVALAVASDAGITIATYPLVGGLRPLGAPRWTAGWLFAGAGEEPSGGVRPRCGSSAW